MKTLRIVLLFLMVLPGLAIAAQDDPWDRKLPFENATITYTLGGMETGTEMLYIKDYGEHTAKYHKGVTSMLGVKMENNTLEFVDPDWVYRYDLKERTGTKVTNPKKYMKEEYDKLTEDEKKQVEKNAREFSVNLMQGGGGKIEENAAEMFGYKVDKATYMGITSYNIHQTPIAMKTEGSMMGMKIDMAATSVEEGKADDKYFAHPEGIEAVYDQRADDMSRLMAQKTMNWLKDPDAAQKAPPSPMPTGMGDQQTSPQDDEEPADPASQVMENVMKGLFGK